MNKLVLIFSVVLFSLAAQTVALERTSKQFIKLENELKIMPAEGFYQNILSAVNKNGDLFILDVGNSQLHHYTKAGKLVTSFGKEGNGPGEFPAMLIDMNVNEKYLYIKAYNKIMIFDYKGKLIKELPGIMWIYAQIVFKDNQVHFLLPKNKYSKTLKSVYSQEGEFISDVKNNDNDPKALAKMRNQFDDDAVKDIFSSPISFYPYKDLFIEAYQGNYHFKLIDKEHNINGEYKAEYKRIKVSNSIELFPRFQREIYKSGNDQVKKMFDQLGGKMASLTGGYKNDIKGVSGADKKYIYIQTSTEKDKNLKLDVVDLNSKKISTVSIETDEVISSKVEHGYLLVNLYNDEDGPYLKVWKVKNI
jgi:hypothetical protein